MRINLQSCLECDLSFLCLEFCGRQLPSDTKAFVLAPAVLPKKVRASEDVHRPNQLTTSQPEQLKRNCGLGQQDQLTTTAPASLRGPSPVRSPCIPSGRTLSPISFLASWQQRIP